MGWDELGNILKQNRRDAAEEARKRRVACPIDGTILVEKDGVLNCPLGNWREVVGG